MKKLLIITLCLFATHQTFTASTDLNAKAQKSLKDVDAIIAKNPNATITIFYDQYGQIVDDGGIEDNLIVYVRGHSPSSADNKMVDKIVIEIFNAVKDFYREVIIADRSTNEPFAPVFRNNLLERMKKIKRVNIKPIAARK